MTGVRGQPLEPQSSSTWSFQVPRSPPEFQHSCPSRNSLTCTPHVHVWGGRKRQSSLRPLLPRMSTPVTTQHGKGSSTRWAGAKEDATPGLPAPQQPPHRGCILGGGSVLRDHLVSSQGPTTPLLGEESQAPEVQGLMRVWPHAGPAVVPAETTRQVLPSEPTPFDRWVHFSTSHIIRFWPPAGLQTLLPGH